ncbi:hypothetical protein OOK43_31970 [[Kitasatospora] papulosa]|uniref:hypothetical protein n=1 Tax=Streptomyces TaxID=1883 RepID=UPI0016827DC6|nr:MULTISPECIES: hypothetical protein [Streptomyces]MBD2835126.1 hypothetical protein [Streptomyces pratensis]MCX4417856.1 hypothetical protein [[Kitasatospora] papulosa]MCY1649355.1 hypothetical protein [Streptomyces sp. SL203]MCY1677067.1 hypothetical protein [Streptomyces sp. SL294]
MPFWNRNNSRPAQPAVDGRGVSTTEAQLTADAGQTPQGERPTTEPGVSGVVARGGIGGVAKGIGVGVGMWLWNEAKTWLGIGDEG